jgi:hypothetical protein
VAHQELYRAFGLWVRHIVLPRAWPKRIPLPDSEDLTEIATMTVTLEHSRDWTLKFRLQGREEGREEGLQTGLQSCQVALLSRQIERKFGPFPNGPRRAFRQADVSQLQQWALNVLYAQSLADVFVGPSDE